MPDTYLETIIVIAQKQRIPHFDVVCTKLTAAGMRHQLDSAADGEPEQIWLGESTDYTRILAILAGESYLWVYRLDDHEDLSALEREHPELDFIARILRRSAVHRGPEAHATTLPPDIPTKG